MRRIASLTVVSAIVASLLLLPWFENNFEHRAVQASGTSLPRDRAIWTAEDFRSYEWYADSCNVAPDTCYAGYRSFFGQGFQIGVPYKWGGWDTIAQFQTKLGQCYGAGDRPADLVVRACTTGVDCSGFVSRVWELPYKRNTYGLAESDISQEVAESDRRRGDAYIRNVSGEEHARLYFRDIVEDSVIKREVYEAQWSDGKVMLNRYTSGQLAGYRLYRLKAFTDHLHTYLPYVKVSGNTNTWVRITELGNDNTSGTVSFYNSNGTLVNSADFSVNKFGTTAISAAGYVSAGLYAAQVTSNNTVAVTAEMNSTPSGFETAAYAGMTNGSDKVYVPLVMRNWGTGSKNTDYDIMNIGNSDASVRVDYYKTGGAGALPNSQTFSISPQGFVNVDVRTQGGGYGSAYGTAVVSSDNSNSTGQVVVTVRQRKDAANSSVLFNGANSEATRVAVRAPLIMNNNNYWNSGLQVQDAGNRTTTATVNYYQVNGGWVKSNSASIAANNAATFYAPSEGLPNPFVGSAVVDTYGSNYQPLAAIINHENASNPRAVAHEGENIGAVLLVAPAVLNRSDYVTGIQVMNIDGSQATVYVDYYDQGGVSQGQVGPIYLNPGVAYNIYPAGPSNFDGSARIWSSNARRLAAIANLTRLGWSGDTDKGDTLPIPRVDEINP